MISVEEAIKLDRACKNDVTIKYEQKYNDIIKYFDEQIKREVREGYLYKEHTYMLCVSCNENPTEMKNLLRCISSNYKNVGWETSVFTENNDKNHIFLKLRIKGD